MSRNPMVSLMTIEDSYPWRNNFTFVEYDFEFYVWRTGNLSVNSYARLSRVLW